MTNAAVIVAAGRGSRATAATSGPKQYELLSDKTVLQHSIQPFLDHQSIDLVQVVIHPEDQSLYDQSVQANPKILPVTVGGATRQASVLCGLMALQSTQPAKVLIHDAARPFLKPSTIDQLLSALKTSPGAISALPVSDTLKSQTSEPTAKIAATIDRSALWRALTPQAFNYQAILAAHQAASSSTDLPFTDDASIAEAANIDVALVEGDPHNFKITTPGDLALARQLVAARPLEPRVGQGYDVHKFTEGSHVTLCGIDVPHTHKLDGHSDADVAMHALTDAILGAIGDGDIGQHFPPTDEQWRGAASDIFLKDAVARVAAKDGRLSNVDVTIVCEAPKIGPHREAMRAELAKIIGIEIDRVGVKATTSERLGFTGRREGIAAMATATVLLSSD
ncbi:MAG: bifunctional 2-C-methyl-D-erythritol 4-phosphate cytidylyltransferase/2-C-methyl-D-erythritol 2,4-cyclodiphosphate synthase [Pseudomonadota bacterium]